MRAIGGRALWIILAVALAVRLGAVAAHPRYVPPSDPADYERIALSVRDGGYPGRTQGLPGPTAYRPPLYPIALGIAYRSAPGIGERTWARLVQAGVGTFTVWLVGVVAFLALRRRRVAIAAMAVAAVWPPMWLYGGAFLSEVLFVPLVLGTIAAALHWRDTRLRRWLVGCGVLLGLATLTRVNGAALALPLAVAMWTATDGPALRRASPVLAMLAAAVVTIAPWTIRNAVEFGRFVPVATEDGYTLAGTYNDVARRQTEFPAAWVSWYEVPTNIRAIRKVPNDELEWNHALRDEALRFVREHPAYVGKVGWWNLRRVFDAAGLPWLRYELGLGYGLPAWSARVELLSFWPVALLALLGLGTRAARSLPRWIGLVPVVLLLPIFLTGYMRFRTPIDALLAISAGCALATLWDRWRGPARA
ncbi:MAG TPA: glycosyltransferase family 39 protein [Solirubrobacteraceae bacterium]|nr:glycosyltransferase family 39 protein [Solirubrobacteraceae bacterium]